jgi:hypothetical protein
MPGCFPSINVTRLDPPRPVAVTSGTLFIDADGDWAVSSVPSGAPDGFFTDDAGELVIDDTAGARRSVFLGGTLVVI